MVQVPGKQRARYTQEFKLQVVRYALSLPANARVKPTCRAFKANGIEPVQIRKWIRALEPLAQAEGVVGRHSFVDPSANVSIPSQPPRLPNSAFAYHPITSPSLPWAGLTSFEYPSLFVAPHAVDEEDTGPVALSRIPTEVAVAPAYRDWSASPQLSAKHLSALVRNFSMPVASQPGSPRPFAGLRDSPVPDAMPNPFLTFAIFASAPPHAVCTSAVSVPSPVPTPPLTPTAPPTPTAPTAPTAPTQPVQLSSSPLRVELPSTIAYSAASPATSSATPAETAAAQELLLLRGR